MRAAAGEAVMRAGSDGVEAVVAGVDLALKLVAFCVGDGAIALEVAVFQAIPTGMRWSTPPVDQADCGEPPLCR